MSRLVINAGTPQATEFPLRAGSNTIGRGGHNSIQIADVSISGSHCEITVQDSGITLKDLGSTNGTFIGGVQVQTAQLINGQSFRLGSVELEFHSDVPVEAPAVRKRIVLSPSAPQPSLVISAPSTPSAPAMPAPDLSTTAPRPGLRIAGHHQPVAEATVAAPVEPFESETPPTIDELAVAPSFCKFHPKSHARYFCRKCNRGFCDLCVSGRVGPAGTSIRTCRSCGVECLPVQGSARSQRVRGFFAQLPGAFIYPFRGMGIFILIFSTIVFAALDFISLGIFTILITMAVTGYVFLFMQNIVHATAAEEKELPGLPDFEGLFGACFTLIGTVLMSFGPAIALVIAKAASPDLIPTAGVVAGLIFGCIYFPMAFLATAIKDTALASNPLIVIPSMLKVPAEYLVTVILLSGVFGIRALGDIISQEAGAAALKTRSVAEVLLAFGFKAVWAFISMYLLTITMRILGLLYVTKKDKLGW